MPIATARRYDSRRILLVACFEVCWIALRRVELEVEPMTELMPPRE